MAGVGIGLIVGGDFLIALLLFVGFVHAMPNQRTGDRANASADGASFTGAGMGHRPDQPAHRRPTAGADEGPGFGLVLAPQRRKTYRHDQHAAAQFISHGVRSTPAATEKAGDSGVPQIIRHPVPQVHISAEIQQRGLTLVKKIA